MPATTVIAEDDAEQDTVTEDQGVDELQEAEQAAATQSVQQGRDDVLKNVREIVQTPSGPRPRWPYPFGYKNVEYGETD